MEKLLMKLRIVSIIAAALTLGAAGVAYALSHNSGDSAVGCAGDCNIAVHNMQMQAGTKVADDGMSMPDMRGGMGMPMHGGHMEMTPARAATAADRARADAIVGALRTAIQPYKDYRVAETAGYIPFHANIPQPMYHFTNYHNAFLNQSSFDPTRPTSLMFKPVSGGYELVGAMYTAPRNSTLDQLDARVPLGVATWHLHVNLCLPPQGAELKMLGPNPQFGLAGSITTADQCAAAGGTFRPVIYGWMVHVWPFETDPTKVWATQEHPGVMND
jgi:hypothetical protein